MNKVAQERRRNHDEAQAETASGLPRAHLGKARPAWLLWLIPLGAILLCVWFLFHEFVAAGPAITILFHDVEGLEEGNTGVTYRGAQVGVVKRLSLTPDSEYVKVSVRLVGSAKNLAREGSIFWIVRPEVKLGGISGLRTIISGEYIMVQPGSGPPRYEFTGADKPPVLEEAGGLHIKLLASDLGSLQEQSPLFYRGVQVGQIQQFQLAADSESVVVEVIVRPEYAPLVRRDSKFWNAGGINFKIGLFRGAQISAESAATLLGGGISFATPTDAGEPATNGTRFTLYEVPEKSWSQWHPEIPLRLPARAPPTTKPAGGLGERE